MALTKLQCLKLLGVTGGVSGITAPTVLLEQLKEENKELTEKVKGLEEENEATNTQLELVNEENKLLNKTNEGLIALNRGLTKDLIDLNEQREEESRNQFEHFQRIIRELKESNTYSQDQIKQLNDTLRHALDQLEQQRKELQQLHLDNQMLDIYGEYKESLDELKNFMAEELPQKLFQVIDDMEVAVSPEYNDNILKLTKLIEESNAKREAFLAEVKKIKSIQVTKAK